MGLTCLLLGGCVSVTEVRGPSGETSQLIKCTSTEDCYDKAREVCGGPYHIDDSGTRTTVGGNGRTGIWSESWHEVLVTCGAAEPAPAKVAPAASASVAPKPAEDAPTSAAGFAFGDAPDAARAACTNASFEWQGEAPTYRCSGTPVDTGLGASARLTFCGEALCRIEVVAKLGDDPSRAASRIESVIGTLTDSYGKPTAHEVAYGASCQRDALPGCLDDGSAHFWYEWQWQGRRKLTLSLGSRKRRPDAKKVPGALTTLRLKYDNGGVVRQSNAASAADEPAAVNGL